MVPSRLVVCFYLLLRVFFARLCVYFLCVTRLFIVFCWRFFNGRLARFVVLEACLHV